MPYIHRCAPEAHAPQLYAWVYACVCAKSLQLCPTLCDPKDYSLQGSFVHGILQGKNTGVGYHALLQGIVLTQGLNQRLLHCGQILYHLSHQGSLTHKF